MKTPTIIAINGSPSPTSRTRRLLEYVQARLTEHRHEVSAVHVRDLPAEALISARADEPRIAQALELIDRAEAVVIATPVYKASYSGLIKTFLDLLPKDGLENKIVLPLATGGSAAHTLVLDYALRPVLGALGARHVLPGVFAVESQVRWSDDAGLELGPELLERLELSLARLFEALPEPALPLPGTPPVLRLLKSAAAAQAC